MFAVLLSHITRTKGFAEEARVRARQRVIHSENAFSAFDAEIPPLSEPGLTRMDSSCSMASPSQLRRWINEIETQHEFMTPDDQEHAWALWLKLNARLKDFQC